MPALARTRGVSYPPGRSRRYPAPMAMRAIAMRGVAAAIRPRHWLLTSVMTTAIVAPVVGAWLLGAGLVGAGLVAGGATVTAWSAWWLGHYSGSGGVFVPGLRRNR